MRIETRKHSFQRVVGELISSDRMHVVVLNALHHAGEKRQVRLRRTGSNPGLQTKVNDCDCGCTGDCRDARTRCLHVTLLPFPVTLSLDTGRFAA